MFSATDLTEISLWIANFARLVANWSTFGRWTNIIWTKFTCVPCHIGGVRVKFFVQPVPGHTLGRIILNSTVIRLFSNYRYICPWISLRSRACPPCLEYWSIILKTDHTCLFSRFPVRPFIPSKPEILHLLTGPATQILKLNFHGDWYRESWGT